MSRKVQVLLEDDIDGTPVRRPCRSRSAEVLTRSISSRRTRRSFVTSFAPWIARGPPASPCRAPGAHAAGSPRRSEDTADIRAWAAEQGIAVSAAAGSPRPARPVRAAAHS